MEGHCWVVGFDKPAGQPWRGSHGDRCKVQALVILKSFFLHPLHFKAWLKMGTPCVLNPKYYVFRVPERIIASVGDGCPDFVVDVEIRLKYSESTAKKLGGDFADAKAIYPVKSENSGHLNRWDLRVGVPHGRSHEVLFCRAAGFTLLKRNGKKLLR